MGFRKKPKGLYESVSQYNIKLQSTGDIYREMTMSDASKFEFKPIYMYKVESACLSQYLNENAVDRVCEMDSEEFDWF